jgi:transaldolase
MKGAVMKTSDLEQKVFALVRKDFWPKFGELKEKFPENASWQRLKVLGSELWLDSGSIEDCSRHWTREFSALTTNNTLLNKEIQTGRYDNLIAEAVKLLSAYPQLTEKQRILEIAFILNAYHALRLVEQFDCFVSVEEHTDLAGEVDLAIDYARRYFAICPERFIVKIPFTPAGLLTTRRLTREGIRINHTLGFGARQNYVIARIAQPNYVNVFLGRLNSFVIDNKLGDGAYIGEKATLASQAAIRKLRNERRTKARQIGASFRSGEQVRDLAGIDVMTMPPKVAGEFLALNMKPDEITDKTESIYTPGVNKDVDTTRIRLETLWDINNEVVECVDALENENLDSFTPDDLINFFSEHGCGDFLVKWSDAERAMSRKEGKIPKLENWEDSLAEKTIGLDSLMNLAGLYSFATDQGAMDDRVRKYLGSAAKQKTQASR